MDTSYPDRGVSVKPHCLEIPLEVAQDHELSDGAILLFGEIYGLICKYGNCVALDPHFMGRRDKGKSTIQAQIKELKMREHIFVETNKHSERKIFVASRYLILPIFEKDEPNFPENWTPTFQETGNWTHKTESSESESLDLKNQDKDKTPESSDAKDLESSIDLSRFLAKDQLWMREFLNAVMADDGYGNTIASARRDVIEMALLQVLKAKRDNAIKSSPIGIIRSVLKTQGDCSGDYIADRVIKLQTALGAGPTAAYAGPKSHQPYRQAWNDEPDAGWVKPPRIRQFRPEEGALPDEDEDPSETSRPTIYLSDRPMMAVGAALLELSNSDAPRRTDAQIEISLRGAAVFRAALEAASGKSLEEQEREAKR